MAMHSSHLNQDQNFSVHFDGVKTNGSSVQKNKGGLGGRKALHDISNSGKPAALQGSRKFNTKNVIPIGEDLGVSNKAQVPIGGKAQISGKKAQVHGRKALADLTNNLVKPFGQQPGLKKRVVQEKKSISVAEYEDENLFCPISQECFLHNHEECIKTQKRAMDLHHFLKTIGLDEDVSSQSVSACNSLPRKSKDEVPIMEEIPMPIIEDYPRQNRGQGSPIGGSPNSPRLSYVNMKDCDDFPNFILADTLQQSNVLKKGVVTG